MSALSHFSNEDIIAVPDSPYFLTPFHPSDKQALVNALNDPLILEYTTRISSPYTLEDAENFISQTCKLPNRHLRAIRTSDGEYVGTISIEQLTPERAKEVEAEEGAWEVGYLLAKEWRGKQVLTPVVRLMVEEFAFKREGLKAICGFASVGNWASRRIMEKVGFEFLGEIGHLITKPNQPGRGIRVWKFIKRRADAPQ
ncbi:uncharacterized protein VTP21DRAFT_2994 [Calcarisporiella thermophila]|uniref:uncharacterized protein n=1 Tax=Calcarisporiella thermophila TaxID=911321 RepID=UPI0037433CCE